MQQLVAGLGRLADRLLGQKATEVGLLAQRTALTRSQHALARSQHALAISLLESERQAWAARAAVHKRQAELLDLEIAEKRRRLGIMPR